MVDQPEGGAEKPRAIRARMAAHVSELTNLRAVCLSMLESGVGAVLVDNPIGPGGLVLASDIVEALAAGAEPDTVWAGEIMRPAPRMVSSDQHPIEVGSEMAAYELEVVAVFDGTDSVRVASALDVLGAVISAATEPEPGP
jgi:CBS domain-containing protein